MTSTMSTPGTRAPRLRRLAAGLIAGAAAAATTLIFPGTASAHVKVSGIDAVQGGSGVLTFRVPSESQTASTVELLITFPTDTPFTSADIQPKAGWTGKVIMKPLPKPVTRSNGRQVTEFVAQVDFKAEDSTAAIPPEQFDMFNISAGPFPAQSSVSFGALQIYSDGTQVNWDEKSANGTEPEHPAPVLHLAPATASAASESAQTPIDAAKNTPSDSSPAIWPGVIGMIAGIIALLVSGAVLVATRRRALATNRKALATNQE